MSGRGKQVLHEEATAKGTASAMSSSHECRWP
jgi:hypothetical protein